MTATLKLGKPKTTVQDRVSVFVSANHLGVFDKTLGRFPAVLVASEAKTVISFFFFFFAKEGPNRRH